MKAVKIKVCFDCGPDVVCVRKPMCVNRGYAAYVVPAPLYRQMVRVIRGVEPVLLSQNNGDDLWTELAKLEKMRRKK